MSKRKQCVQIVLVIGLAASGALAQVPVGTAFRYQGHLEKFGSPVIGTADFVFTLWDAAAPPANPVGPPVFVGGVNVDEGLFTVELDFGVDAWVRNEARWLEIVVEFPLGSGLVPLTPWQELTPTPFSLATRGVNVDAADNVGLGTVTPTEKLHVDGNILATGTVQSGTSITIDGTNDTITASSGTITFPDTSVVVTNANIFTAPGPTLPGWVAIGEAAPYAPLHLNNFDIPQNYSAWLYQEDLVAEDGNAWAGLYSEAVGGQFSSGITLAELRAASFDKWSIFRTDDPNVTELRVTFGDQVDPHLNTRMMSVWQDSDIWLAPVRGDVGIGFEGEPLGKLHVTEVPIPTSFVGALWQDDAIIEDEAAYVGLYSSDEIDGAGVTLAQVPSIGPVDKWGLYRQFTGAQSVFDVTWGEDADPTSDPDALRMQIAATGDTRLAPVTGRVGVGPVGLLEAPLHVYRESTVAEDNVAVFEKQGTNDYAVAIGGRRIDAVNMAGGADPQLLLNYWVTGDVILAYGQGHASGGNVGIGEYFPTERLDVDGTARLRGMPTGTGTNVVVSSNGTLRREISSLRYKTNIRALPSDPPAVLMLRPVGFDWRSTGESDVGLIAEEVAEVIPELVVHDSTGRPEAVHYHKVALYLLQVVKQQQQRLAALEEAVEQSRSLQARVAELERRLGQTSVGAK